MPTSPIPTDRFLISTAPERLDIPYLLEYLRASYWAKDLNLERFETSVANSLCFGVYEGTKQVGFARVVTDRATFGYVADVFIDDHYRGLGLGNWLMECIQNHPDLTAVRKLLLQTLDAHSFYQKLGFEALSKPEMLLEWIPEASRKNSL
ncbi:MAG: GNAT family N-acetyltransferase [Salibacteraceae bacterium]